MNNNVVYLGEPYMVQTMNMVRKHLIELRKNNLNGENDHFIALNDGALRSYYNEVINGPEASSEKLAA